MMTAERSLFFAGLALLALLAGCAPKGEMIRPQSDASIRWQTFEERSSHNAAYDVLSGSLRFGPEDDTRRVTYLLWSGQNADSSLDKEPHEPAGLEEAENGMPDDGRAIRLEVNAGVGANVAKALFENGRMLLVLPRDEKAYAGVESPENLRRLLGLPLPFRMSRLNDFLAGRYLSALDAPSPERYLTGSDGNIIYQYRSGGTQYELELNADALPVRWSAGKSWTLDMDYDENALPRRLDGHMEAEGKKLRLVLLVKGRAPSDSLAPGSLQLDVPAAFAVYSLDY